MVSKPCVAMTLAAGLLATCFSAPAALAADLKIGIAGSPTSMDPQFYVIGTNSAMARNIFDGLVNQDDRQQLKPALATEWTAVDDTTWQFHLREGVKFHDGSDFDADDVVASIARVKLASENSPSSFMPYVKGITAVTAIDPMTVEFKTETAMPLLPNNLSRIAILPSEEGETPSSDLNTGKGVIGTGPFKFVSWIPDSTIELARNDDYWGDVSEWDNVTYKVFSNPSARVASLLSGDVDMIEQVPPADIGTLENKDGVGIVSNSSNRVMYLHMDQDRDDSPFAKGPDGQNPLKDVRVRHGLSLAINRQAIIDRIMDKQGVPAGQLVPEGYTGYVDSLKPDPYDPKKAKELFAEAGYPNGFDLTFHASNDRYPNDSLVAQAIGQMFTRVGINTDIVTLPKSVYFSRASALEFSFIMGGAAVETGEASGVLGPLLETYGDNSGRGNRGRYSSKAFDEALQRGRSLLDADARDKALQDAMKIAIDDMGVIPVFFLAHTWGLENSLTYNGRTDGYTLAANVHSAK
ncbi:peptide/nickel transport system substrate-binding protein [Cohaesibacter marisflavi]|uniref:Peptide/nickel transport system substrate-binding protein n=1 Tax=Cohaesibacter marisflavi TaxID=655353 RepID=A0A1I5JU91_9HYPH|nr:ABC transporter substrate-binding protein [Cohaesibacter marisflavi]SFO76280.1 peptide/nickel transport system substrate-binding protein [Cohaesibacter marisflavi]